MNKIIKNTLILTAITLVSGLLLGFVHELTAAPIAEQEALAKAKAYAEVFPEAASFNELEDVTEVAAYIAEQGYTSQVINEVAEACDASGNVVGHVINITTPEGYGGNIQTDTWKAQFAGIQADEIAYTKSGKSAPNEIDAVSSATITTKAVTGAVNAALCAAGHYAE